MLDKVYIFSVTGYQILITIFFLFFLIYWVYQHRLNNFILRKIDFIIIGLLLILTYKFINLGEISYFNLILGISAFFIGFLQFRKNKEYEILIKEYTTNNNIENLIESFIVLSPILADERNLKTIIKNKISSSMNNIEELKKIFLQVIKSTGNEATLIGLLKDLKKDKESIKKTLKQKDDIKDLEKQISILKELINNFKETETTFFSKDKILYKIKIFFTP